MDEVKNIYVGRRSELTALKEGFERAGFECYRVQFLLCECDRNYRTSAVIVMRRRKHVFNIIRCWGCVWDICEGGAHVKDHK